MWFSLEVLRACKGDCLLLHFGKKDDPHLVLIDGGPSNVYHPFLRPRLDRLRVVRALDDQDPLPVDVIMVSHVDDDHIKGILELTQDLREKELSLKVDSLWHNTFDDLLKTTPEELQPEARYGAAALGGTIETADAVEFDAAKVLASIPQGRDLRDAARLFRWKINDKFKGRLILATGPQKAVSLKGGLNVTVVGPMKAEVEALQEEHDKWLREHKAKSKSGSAALAAYVDESVSNLSSIVVLAEADGQTMLLTGDARGDKILEGLEFAGLAQKDATMDVNILKVPHHGSANNLDEDFFRRIRADHYVFSGNGEHGNPERETLQMLLDARGNEDYTVHLTYSPEAIDVKRKEDWEKEQTKEKNRKKKKPSQKVRPDWKAERHSLESFLDGHPKFNDKLSIVADDEPHVIDLLEKVPL